MSHAKYLELNERLAEVMFSLDNAGRPVYVGAEESDLSRAVEGIDTGGRGALEYLCHVTRSTLNLDDHGVSPFRWYVERLRSDDDVLATPATVALAVVLAVAADQMAAGDGMAANNYYGRLAQLLDVPDERFSRLTTDYQKVAEDIWGSVNDWLVAWEGSRGVPTAYAIGHRHVGLPMSQALVREHDRNQLTKIFRAEGLPPGLQMTPRDMEDVLGGWVSRTPSPLSHAFRSLFQNSIARERMLSVVCLELEAWDGTGIGDGELGQASLRSFGDLRLIAVLRQFLGSALEINLLVPLVDGHAEPLRVAAGDEEVSLDVMKGAGGTGRLAHVDALDLDSLLIDHLEGVVGEEDRPVERRPRRVVPLRWHDLQSAYVEVERVERGDQILLLALGETQTRLLEFLEVAARPGFSVHGALDGLPDGWIVVSDVQIMAAVEGSFHRDFQPLIPRAQTSLAFSGGLSLPGNLRKWATLAPPELHAVAAGAERITVRVDEGSRMGEEIDRLTFEGESAVVDVTDMSLDDGEYLFTLFVGDSKSPASTALLRLRSADTPVSAEAIDGGRLVYEPGDGPSWPISASEPDGGPSVDGVLVSDDLVISDASGSVTDFWTRPKPVTARVTGPRIRVGRQLGDDSCMHTGAHRFHLPPAGAGRPSSASVEGECDTCGIVRRFPTTAWAAKKRASTPIKKKLHVNQLASELPPVRSEHTAHAAVMLDAVSHVGSGSMNDLARIASAAEASAVFADTYARDLEAMGHVDLRRDEMSNVVEWGVNFPTLVPTATGWYLSGRTSPSLVRGLQTAGKALGGTVILETDGHLVTVRLQGLSIEEPLVASVLEDHEVRVLTENPAMRLAASLPRVTDLVAAMPRRPIPASKRLERWDTPSASWIETDSLMAVGAYRISNFSRVYCVRNAEDLALGAIRISNVQVVKHVASAWANDPLVGYHALSGSLLVPRGADLPGLYARAAVVASGRAPRVTSAALQYRDVPRAVSDVLYGKLSS